MSFDRVTVFAPATVANVAAGFDVLGFAVEGAGDRVVAQRLPAAGVVVGEIAGVVKDLPRDPQRNTASVAAISLLQAAGASDLGVRLDLHKGIALGSGMGGSAASAVAAVLAVNQLLDRPLPLDELLRHAARGEEAASGAAHVDNAAPSLFGGMTAVVRDSPPEVARVPLPAWLRVVLVRPHIQIETRAARAVLPVEIPLRLHVEQSQRLAGLLIACFGEDVDLMRRSMCDLIAEPARACLIPGFAAARAAAIEAGAIGFGIGGAGPTVFAWCDSDQVAGQVARATAAAFVDAGHECSVHVSAPRLQGAVVESAS